MTTTVPRASSEETRDGGPAGHSSTRVRVAQVLALVALASAAVGAFGPAEAVRSTYAWPPPTLPSVEPRSAWYTPLLLAAHRPDAIDASVPCSLPPALPGATTPVTVLATARSPERTGGLAVTGRGRQLVVSVGEIRLAQAPLRTGAGDDCAYRLRFAGQHWSLEGGLSGRELRGALTLAPVVSGLFTGLDLRGSTRPSVEVTTAVHRSRVRPHQTVAWTLAVVCALAALALVAFARLPRPWPALRGGARGALAEAHAADALVAVVLLAWWFLSPLFADDGWIVAREQMFSNSGGFSSYYDSFAANLPNDYWLEWAQHWLADNSLLVVRLPALLALAGTWVLCRFVLTRVLPVGAGERTAVLLTLATVFLVGAMSWGMTARPEPFTALFVTAVLACVVRFVERGSAAPLALVAVLIPFAVTAHHAAVTAFAPLLVAAPALLRWARAQLPAATAIVPSAIALLAVLLFVGADLEQRRADAQTFANFSVGQNWRSEGIRYFLLLEFPYGTPIRRASVALAVLAVLAFVLRRRRERHPLLGLPAASLGVSLVLLLATPSKHPWHFGALLGLTALAVAVEARRLRAEGLEEGRWTAKPLVAIGAAVVAIAWSWSPRHAWNAVDLRTLDWTLGFENTLGLARLAVILPLLLLAAALLAARLRRRGSPLWPVPPGVVLWTGCLFATPLIVFTLAVLAADTVRTDSWTLGRQNLGALTGDVGCGLADDLTVADARTARALQTVVAAGSPAVPSWVPPAPFAGASIFALGPAGGRRASRTPWFAVPPSGRFGLFLSGAPSTSDRLGLEWGRERRGRIASTGAAPIATSFATEAGASLPWRFVAASELPRSDDAARLVRVVLRSDVAPGASIAVTSPVAYEGRSLAKVLNRPGERQLVLPSLYPAFPCARLPELSGGVVEPPHTVVTPRDSRSPVRFDYSPFLHVFDLHRLERLPLADSANPPVNTVVFGVEQAIPGAGIVEPVRRDVVS